MTNKTVEDFNFRNHGTYDIAGIAQLISGWEDEWTIDTSRQNVNLRPNETQNENPQKDTQAHFITNFRLQWTIGEPWQSRMENQAAFDVVEPLVRQLESAHDGKYARIFLAKLPAGKVISAHSDWQEYLLNCRRHHIAVTTNANVDFTVGDETINMAAGEIWEINNGRVHSVVNGGEFDRDHLIVDILPNALLG